MVCSKRGIALLLAGFFSLAACENAVIPIDDPLTADTQRDVPRTAGSVLGGEGFNVLDLLGPGDSATRGGGGVGVNSYLWRASLDTVSFMPLASADPFGGVIITDWYTPPETPNERFKMNVYILGMQLRADGIRVALFRQNRGDGQWSDAKIGKDTVIKLENAILTRARQLRFAARSDVN